MSNALEAEPGPQPPQYVGAYRLARETWLHMLTDDEACRDIWDRETYLGEKMVTAYPMIPAQDIVWLGNFALDAVLDDFHH